MNNDETVKLMAETLKDGLNKFVGSSVSQDSVKEMTSHMTRILRSFMSTDGLIGPLPEIKVSIDLNIATIFFFDPKDGKEISLATWMSRANEGYYG